MMPQMFIGVFEFMSLIGVAQLFIGLFMIVRS